MKNKITRCLATAALCGAAFLPASARAQASTYTYGPTMSDWTHAFNVAQFDSSLGTLNSVSFTLIGTASYDWTLYNSSSSTANYTVGASTDVSVLLPGTLGSLVTTISYSSLTPVVVAAGTSGSASSGNQSQTTSFTLRSTDVDLSAFIRSLSSGGTVSLSASTSTKDNARNTTGNTGLLLSTTAGVTMEVTYNYSVPEPTSLSLLAGAGLSLWAWKRRSAKA
jgi:hypothetical protein